MALADVGIFKLAEQRLLWAGHRQKILAQNVANANTPGYQPKDLASFKGAIAQATGAGQVSRTDPAHIAVGSSSNTTGLNVRGRERAPDGNAVSLEDELTKVADTASTQELVTNLYRKYQGMFRIALGRGG